MNAKTLKGIKKWLSAIGILAIMSTFVVVAPVANAYSGDDAVAQGLVWAKDSVDAACEKGLIDCELPDAGFKTVVNRAVGYQMLTKGFDVYNENAMSQFPDVSGEWYEYAAHTAYVMGWTAGESGKFNGGGELSRAMMAVAAASVLGLSDCDATVLDAYTDKASVPAWATDAMACVVEAKLMGQGGAKVLNPNKGAIKAEVITILNAQVDYASEEGIDVMEVAAERLATDTDTLQEALDTGAEIVDGELVVIEGEEEIPTEEEEEIPTGPAGSLTIAVASDSPTSKILADGTAGNVFTKVLMTAASGTVKVTGLKLTHTGISTDAVIGGVYVVANGLRHGNVVTFSENKAELSFSTDPITVTEGSPVTVSLMVNIATTAASSTMGVGILASTDVTSDATSVSGSAMGVDFTTVDGANSVGSVDPDVVVIGATARAIDMGTKDQELSRFQMAAGSTENVLLKKMTVYNNGNSADGDIQNIRLKSLTTGAVLATVEKTANKYATFDLSATPFKIEKGRTETFQIVVDVIGGSTRTAQFRIMNDYDLELSGESTGAGILAATGGAGTDTAFPITDGNNNSITIGGGALLTSKDTTSPSGNMGQGAKNQVLGKWKIEATGEPIEVRKVCFDLDAGTTGTLALETTAFTGTIKLQKSSGSTIYSFAPTAIAGGVDGTCDEVTLNSYFTIAAGASETVSIVTDILSTVAANTVITTEFAVNEYKRNDTNDIVSGGADANALASNALTVQAANLSIVVNPAYATQTLVKGSPKTKIGSVVLQAGAAEALNLQTLTIGLNNDENRATADTLTGVTNLRLCKAGSACATADDLYATAIANPSGAVAGNSFTTSGKLNLAASSAVTVDIHADLSTTAPGTNLTKLEAFLPIAAITFTGQTSNVSNSTYPVAVTGLQVITLTASGTLTVSSPVQPSQKVIHASETGVELMSVQFAAASEAITIDKMLVTTVNGAANLTNLTLKDSAGTPVKSGIGFVSGNATFTGLALSIPKDGTATYKLYADSTTSGTLVSAQDVEVRFGSVDARGANSNTAIMETGYMTELLVNGTTSVGHYTVGDVILVSGAANAAATDGLVVAAIEEDANLTTSTSILGSTNTAGFTLAKIKPTATGTTLNAGDVSSIAMVVGDVVMTALDGAAYQWGMATAASDAAAQPTLAFAAAAAAAVTYTVDGKISKFTPTATTATTVANPPVLTSGMTFTVGDVVFGPTATNASTYGWQVVTVAETIGAGAATDTTVRINGANTYINGNMSVVSRYSKFTPLSTETVTTVGTTTAAYSYNTGDVVYVYDGNADADDGLFVVETPMKAGDTWAATSMGVRADIGNASVVSKLFSSTNAPKSSVNVMHDVEPIMAKSATALSTDRVSGALQEAAIYTVTASGSRNLTVKSLTFRCTGSGAANTHLDDNTAELWVDGALRVTNTGTTDGTGDCDAAAGRTMTLANPGITIDAGTSKEFKIKYDTTATAGQWATGESLVLKIQGTAGYAAGGLSWYYDAAAPSPGTEPTYDSPATISDSYPVDGPTLTY